MNNEITLTYYAKITQESDGYIVPFRDLSNVFTEGDSLEEALFNAQEALDGVLLSMMEEDHDIPYPSKAKTDEHPIPLSPNIAAPILLYLLRKQRAQTMTHVANAMHVPYQQYQRLEHNCNMTLKSLNRAAAAMGGRVEIKLYL